MAWFACPLFMIAGGGWTSLLNRDARLRIAWTSADCAATTGGIPRWQTGRHRHIELIESRFDQPGELHRSRNTTDLDGNGIRWQRDGFGDRLTGRRRRTGGSESGAVQQDDFARLCRRGSHTRNQAGRAHKTEVGMFRRHILAAIKGEQRWRKLLFLGREAVALLTGRGHLDLDGAGL